MSKLIRKRNKLLDEIRHLEGVLSWATNEDTFKELEKIILKKKEELDE